MILYFRKNSFFYFILLIGYLIRNFLSFRCWEVKFVSGFKKKVEFYFVVFLYFMKVIIRRDCLV